jgi:hypothetical protein
MLYAAGKVGTFSNPGVQPVSGFIPMNNHESQTGGSFYSQGACLYLTEIRST